jgi:hypothetical protein
MAAPHLDVSCDQGHQGRSMAWHRTRPSLPMLQQHPNAAPASLTDRWTPHPAPPACQSLPVGPTGGAGGLRGHRGAASAGTVREHVQGKHYDCQGLPNSSSAESLVAAFPMHTAFPVLCQCGTPVAQTPQAWSSGHAGEPIDFVALAPPPHQVNEALRLLHSPDTWRAASV